MPDRSSAAPSSADPRVLAVDGNSLGHRGFHSARADAQPGTPFVTGAVVSMLASAWIEGPFDAIVVAFDHADNRRKERFAGYKANRAEPDPDLPAQLTALRTHLASCGWLVVEHPGAEADDLLAAATDACNARGWRCDVLSSDRDLTALVGPTVRLLRPRARFSDLVVEDEQAVRATYGIEPSQYTELAALRGDPSDGLDGARGIGPKTAARLLRDHGSIAALYAALTDLHPRVEASLREGRERVERNLELMAPIPHLDVDVEAAVHAGVDADRVHAALEPLGLEVAARRFARALSAPSRSSLPPVPPPPDEPAFDVDHASRVGSSATTPARTSVPAPAAAPVTAPATTPAAPATTPAASPSTGEQVPLF